MAAATGITLSAVQAPSALAQVTQAAARTAEQSYRVTSVSTEVASVGPGPRSPLTIRGEFDRAHKLGEEPASDGSEVRYVGGYMYVPVVEAMRKAYAPPAGSLGPSPTLSPSPGRSVSPSPAGSG